MHYGHRRCTYYGHNPFLYMDIVRAGPTAMVHACTMAIVQPCITVIIHACIIAIAYGSVYFLWAAKLKFFLHHTNVFYFGGQAAP